MRFSKGILSPLCSRRTGLSDRLLFAIADWFGALRRLLFLRDRVATVRADIVARYIDEVLLRLVDLTARAKPQCGESRLTLHVPQKGTCPGGVRMWQLAQMPHQRPPFVRFITIGFPCAFRLVVLLTPLLKPSDARSRNMGAKRPGRDPGVLRRHRDVPLENPLRQAGSEATYRDVAR